MHQLSAACTPYFRFQSYKHFNSYQKLPNMNFQDNLEKVRDLYAFLSFLRIKEITLYFLVHYKNMEHQNFLFYYYYICSFSSLS